MNIKSDFLTALNLTPDGIDNFVGTPIPVLVSFSDPSDVDSSIIAQGKLAYNLNLILKAFEGLTPIELLLRIGQHNSVLQSALLAGLEYVQGEGAYDFIVSLDPTINYTSSPIEFSVEAVQGGEFAKEASCDIVTLSKVDGEPKWIGSYAWEEYGTPSFNFVVIFETPDGDYSAEKSVTIQVGGGGQP